MAPGRVPESNEYGAFVYGSPVSRTDQYAVKVGDLQWVRIPPGQSVARPEATRAAQGPDSEYQNSSTRGFSAEVKSTEARKRGSARYFGRIDREHKVDWYSSEKRLVKRHPVANSDPLTLSCRIATSENSSHQSKCQKLIDCELFDAIGKGARTLQNTSTPARQRTVYNRTTTITPVSGRYINQINPQLSTAAHAWTVQ